MVGITEKKETQINTRGLLGVTIKKKHTVCQLKIKCLFIPLYVTFFGKTSVVLGLCKYCKPTFSIHLQKKFIYINVV